MQSIRIMLATSAGMAALIGAANAQDYGYGQDYRDNDTRFYVSAGYNYLDFNEELGGAADISALTGRAGWKFSPILSVEGDISFGFDNGSFDFSGDEDDLDFDDNADGDLDDVIAGDGELGMDYLIGLYARAGIPVGDRLEISARAGYAFVELDSTVETLSSNELILGGSDDGFALGASATYDLSAVLSLRADYTHYEFGDANAESLGINLQVNF